MTKLTLEVDERKVTFELDEEDVTFDDVLHGFLGCMFGIGYVPGTEMHCFQNYIDGMSPLYVKQEIPEGLLDKD
jgi:hypothetical protein